jgi:hypothetical protein
LIERPRGDPSFLRRSDAAALVGLSLIPIFIFFPALFGGKIFWQRDVGLYWYPQIEAFVRTVAEGALPVWNPFVSFGLPLLADPSCQVLYPFTWLNLVLLPATYYKLYTVVHIAAAGIGLFYLTRRWGMGRFASFVSGAVWMTSGPLLVVVSHYHHLAGTAWLPWTLLALDTALASGTPRAAFVLGAVAAGQVLAGSGDLCLMTAFAALGYTCSTLIAAGSGFLAARIRRVGFVALIAAAVASLLSAPQWLPTVATLSSGQRLRLEPAVKMSWSLHPTSLVDLFVPRLVSDLPLNDVSRAALFDSREPLFNCIYLGAAAAAMVAATLTLRWNRFTAFSAGGFALSILAALGRHTPFYPLLLQTTPVSLFRYPAKYTILAGFFWAALCGLAFDEWLRRRDAAAWRLRWRLEIALPALFAVVLLAALLSIAESPRVLLRAVEPIDATYRSFVLSTVAGKLATGALAASVVAILAWVRGPDANRNLIGLALAAVVLTDLWAVGRSVNPLAPPEMMNVRPRALALMTPGARLWVSLRHSPGLRDTVRGPMHWDREWSWMRGMQELIRPPLGARWGLHGSYDGDFTGLGPPLLSNLTLILQNAVDSPLGVRILQMGGVEFVLSFESWRSLLPVAEFDTVFADPIRLYRVPGTLSRAYVSGTARVAAEPQSVEALADPGLDPQREVIVPPGSPTIAAGAGFEGSVRQLWRRGDSIGLECDTNGPALAVILEAFHPGWRARVDGRPTGIVRANVLFQAVPLSAGRHTVVFEYRPFSVVWGLVLCAVGLVLAAIIFRNPRARAPRVDGTTRPAIASRS